MRKDFFEKPWSEMTDEEFQEYINSEEYERHMMADLKPHERIPYAGEKKSFMLTAEQRATADALMTPKQRARRQYIREMEAYRNDKTGTLPKPVERMSGEE